MKPNLFSHRAAKIWSLCGIVLLASSQLWLISPAAALPSFARQTGQECPACHNGFPELTPYGRLFKLNGYVFPGSTATLPPVSAMVVPSFTHTDKDQPGGAAQHFGPNDNFSFTGSLFYGGAISTELGIGAFVQTTYDHTSRRFAWDNTDIRIARSLNILGSELLLGVTVNNNPTVTDVWNSTPAWGFPFVGSGVAPTPAAGTLIEGGLAQQVIGPTIYGYWNRLVYAEIGGYRTLSPQTLTDLGVDPTGSSSIKNFAPYWRVAVEPKWGRSSFELGTFGMAATLNPGRVTGSGTDHLVDTGFDTQYQWLGDRHSVSLQASWIHENQTLSATNALGGSTNTHDHLRSLRAKATYWYQQTYGGTVGYFRLDGKNDPGLFGGASVTGSPNSDGWIAELDYMPFAYGGPEIWPWLNLKLGVQYIWYDKFNGGRANFDGAGRNVNDNNTLFVFVWLAF
jgi:hypothetical protein